MDLAYLALIAFLWLLMAGLAVGCDKLTGGSKS